MGNFIRNIILFGLLSTSLIVGIDRFLSSLINQHASFAFDPAPRYVFFGHSHPECAYNDSLIQDSRNIAESSEAYFYTYLKVKKVLEQNPSVETLFIECTNNQISPKMNDWTWDSRHLSHKYTKYAPFIHLSDQITLLLQNPRGFLTSLPYSIKRKFTTVARNDYDFSDQLGGYKYLVRYKTDSLLQNLNPLAAKDELGMSATDSVSRINLNYLRRIIEIIRKNNKHVVLVRTPIHPMYEGYVNESLYKRIIRREFSDVDYLDFSKFPLQNEEFGDLGHLNHQGAKIFSEWFNQLLTDSLLIRPEKQKFIESRMPRNQ